MATTDRPAQVIQIRADDTSVVVTPEDQDRFVMQAKEVVRSIGMAGKIVDFQQKYQILLRTLASWLLDSSNSEDVDSAIVTPHAGRILFLVVRRTVPANPALTDLLSDLEIRLAQDADLRGLSVETLALPACEPTAYSSFIGSVRHEFQWQRVMPT